MDLPPLRNHHRRRSSVLTTSGIPFKPRLESREESSGPRASPRDGDGPRAEEQRLLSSEDTDSSDLSSVAQSDLDMDHLSSDDDLNDDEETGLTAQQRSARRRRRRKQRRRLDARIADVKASKKPGLSLALADKDVIKRLLINAALISLWYLFSLSISIYNKWMFSKDNVVFPLPLFTTSLHMLVQFLLSASILYFFPFFRPPMSVIENGSTEPSPIMTKFFYLTRLVPCGAATSLDIGLGNMSLKFISLTFLTMCKSSALAFVLLFAFIFRLEALSVKLILIIATMTIGVIMMVAGETDFNALGFALVIASAFFSGFRWGLTQILLLRHPATSNPFSTLFFLTPVMFASLLSIALAVEGPAQISQGFRALAAAKGPALGVSLLVFPGILAFCMITAEFALLKRSSVVTLSICGIFKEVVTISAAGVVFHDKLTLVNISGLIITITSIASYNYMKISKMRQEAQNSVSHCSDGPRPQRDGE
ncbi:Triose-phosphate Transporter family domain containing protein [Elaphomyces granulatus]